MHVPSEISQLDGELSCVAFVLLEHFSPLGDKTNLTRSSTKWYYYQMLYTSPHCLLLNIEESAFPAGRQHDKCHTIAGPVLAGSWIRAWLGCISVERTAQRSASATAALTVAC